MRVLLFCLLCGALDLRRVQAHTPDTHNHQHEPLEHPLDSEGEDDDLPRVNLGMDIEHIKADLGRLGLSTEKLDNLTEEEMDFYFFTLHDFNNDTMLDGCEIMKAVTHTIEENVDRVKAQPDMTAERLKRHINHVYDVIAGMVDEALAMADTNFDGYLSYTEYMTAKRDQGVPDEEGGKEERDKDNHKSTD